MQVIYKAESAQGVPEGQDQEAETVSEGRPQVMPGPSPSLWEPGGGAASSAGSQGAGLHVPTPAGAPEPPAVPLEHQGRGEGVPGEHPRLGPMLSELMGQWTHGPVERAAGAATAS